MPHSVDYPGEDTRVPASTGRPEQDAPVRYDPLRGYWVVQGPEDVRRVLLQPEVFRPDNALTAVVPLHGQALRILAHAGVVLPATLANNGTSTHAELRRMVAQLLTSTKVRAQRPNIVQVAHTYLDAAEAELASSGSCDLVPDLATNLPAEILLDVLDLDGPHRPDVQALKRWSAASFELFWGWPTPDRQAELATEVAAFHGWLVSAIEAARRGEPVGGLFRALAAHRDRAGRPLPLADAASIGYFSLIAGQETTSYLLATLLRHAIGTPGLWRQISATPQLAAGVVDDVLRHETPVTTWRRVTSRAVTLAGVQLPAGAELLLMLGCPRTMAVTDPGSPPTGGPKPTGDLAFGVGTHRCLGAELARLEATVVTQVAAQRLPDLELVDIDREGRGDLTLLSFRAPRSVRVRAGPR